MYRILNHTANERQDGHRMSYQVPGMYYADAIYSAHPNTKQLKCDERDTAWLIDFALNHF